MSTGTKEITNTEDTIDSRDIIDRIEYLEGLKSEADEDEKAELATLKDLEKQAGTSEWSYGVVLIRESYFKDYAVELAEDLGAIGSDTQWPATHIDWNAAADELLIDYSAIDFDGVTYYFR